MRLIDIDCHWLWQYAGEITTFDPTAYASVASRLGRLDGYLQATSLAVLRCGRAIGDRTAVDPWLALSELLALCEAEFSGRLLIGAADCARWRDEPEDGLCWGVLEASGVEDLLREQPDIDRIGALFDRGVRVFSLASGSTPHSPDGVVVDGSRGLTDLGHAALDRIDKLAVELGPRPIIDLAGLDHEAIGDVLAWAEARPSERRARTLLMWSQCPGLSDAESPGKEIARANLTRFRAEGGLVGVVPGPPFAESREALKSKIDEIATIPWRTEAGYDGIAIGTNALARNSLIPKLEAVHDITAWVESAYDRDIASRLIARNAMAFFTDAAHGPISSL
jgi:microsomal dipeptidase-like Zn-dependent dipeptidase